MKKYPPYVNAYGKIPELFKAIKEASVPTKFTQDFMYTMLNLKSTSFRAMIPLLKNLGFLDQSNGPTESYKNYRDESSSKIVMAKQLKRSYAELFSAHEFANKLTKEQLTSKLRTILGVGNDDPTIPSVVGTFMELVKLSDFENDSKSQIRKQKTEEINQVEAPQRTEQKRLDEVKTQLGISYTINLNLPATTEIEVFNAIFKSLKDHILNE